MSNSGNGQPAKKGPSGKILARREARTLAMQALYSWHIAGQPLNEIEAQFRVDNDFSGVDGAYFRVHHFARQQASPMPLLAAIAEGGGVAYCSDAGTPLVADPGFALARAVSAAGGRVHAVPGASALLAALTIAGQPTDRFLFAGFAPTAQTARRRWLAELAGIAATVVIFESPRRVKQLLGNLCELEANRPTVICRELTKRFEEVMRGTAEELMQRIPDEGLRGEIVVLFGHPPQKEVGEDDLRQALSDLPADLPVKEAAARIAARFGLPRRDVYALALAIRKENQ